jgi:hypothetical protein
MDDRVILDEPGMKVTTAVVQVEGKTYATRNIGGVALRQHRPGVAQLLLALVGFGAMFADHLWFGLVLVAFALVYASMVARLRTVTISAGGVEGMALWTANKAQAQRLHDAVVEAIAAR